MKKFLQKLTGKLTDGKKLETSTRPTRVRLSQMDPSWVETTAGRRLPLRNLSETGIAVGGLQDGPLPDLVQGRLRLGPEELALQFRVVWRTDSDAGGRFEGDASAIRGFLRRVLGDELKAAEMSEVGSNLLSSEEPGSPRWFYAPGNYEFFLLERDGQVARFELEWNGNVIAGAAGAPLRFGRIAPEDRQKPEHAKSPVVQWAAQVPAEHRAKAARLVDNIPGLDETLKGRIKEMIRSSG